MPLATANLPDDLAAAHAMILAERAARLEAEERVSSIAAEMSSARLEIERLKLLLAKARRAQYGQSSERGAKLIEQLELQLAELEESAAEEDPERQSVRERSKHDVRLRSDALLKRCRPFGSELRNEPVGQGTQALWLICRSSAIGLGGNPRNTTRPMHASWGTV